MSSNLSSDNLREVYGAVVNIRPDKVYDFGLALGLHCDVIDTLKESNGKVRHFLREILKERLKQKQPLTWRDIVKALEYPLVDEGRIANKVLSDYCHPPSSVPQQEGAELPSVPQRERAELPSVPQRERAELPSVPQRERAELPSVPQRERAELSSVPQLSQQERAEHSSTHTSIVPSPQQSNAPSEEREFHTRSLQAERSHPTALNQSQHNNTDSSPLHDAQYPLARHDRSLPTGVAKNQVTQPEHTQSQAPHASMLGFIEYVKTFYKGSVIRDPKLPKTPTDTFVNVMCIDRSSTRECDREAVVRDGKLVNCTNSIAKIAENLPAASFKKVILVEGAPGVGKSTLAWEFCRRWERGEIAQQYRLVLLLRLSDKKISKARTLKDLICHPLEDVPQVVYDELVFSCNFHVLIILEGFDELPDACRKDESIFMELIAGNLLPLATILVTSRPWATQGIQMYYGNRIYQNIKILGFTGQQITEYIESTLPQDKVSDLKAYLESHPQIRAGMYIPVNSAIVVTVYEESLARGYAMPSTLTELYTSLTQILLLRYLRGHPEYEADCKYLLKFKDLPQPVYTKFSELCKIAYKGTIGVTDEVQLIFRGLPSDFDDLGFMDSVTELYVTRGAVSSHNFLHLTFQEFFAAVHISSMSQEQQVEHFKRHEEGRLKVVLRFLAGMNKLNSLPKEANNFFQVPSRCKEYYNYLMSCAAEIGIDPL